MIETATGDELTVVDGQVHLNFLGLDEGLAAMDALGIDHVVIDEWRGWDEQGMRKPNAVDADGIVHYGYTIALDGPKRQPDRFSSVAWVDRKDPQLRERVAEFAADPGRVALRVVLRQENGDDFALERGEYEPLFAAAAEYAFPLMICTPYWPRARRFSLLPAAFRRHPDTPFIVDHCGVLPFAEDASPAERGPESLRAALAYAEMPHVALKWSHAPRASRTGYPFADVVEELGRIIAEIGAERILWGSDTTQARDLFTWEEGLLYLASSPTLSASDKEWILGGTARRILGKGVASSHEAFRSRSSRENRK